MIHEPNKEFERLTSSRCCRFGAFACSALQDVHLSLGHWISWKDPEPSKVIKDRSTKSTPKFRTTSSLGCCKRASSRQDATKGSLKCSPLNSLLKNILVEKSFSRSSKLNFIPRRIWVMAPASFGAGSYLKFLIYGRVATWFCVLARLRGSLRYVHFEDCGSVRLTWSCTAS